MTSYDETIDTAEERHASNLELFLDLVFVFAVTQLATLIGEQVTTTSVLHGTLLAGLVWWQWSQYTWAGAAIDLQANVVSRLLVLVTVPVTLLMTTAIPEAFGGSGRWFGWAYFGVQVMVIGMQGRLTVEGPEHRSAFLRYSSVALVSPVIVVVGAYLAGDARVVAWSIAVVIDVVAALRGAGGDWSINATHFAERHALFVIIALGEVVVAAGATTYSLSHEHGLTAQAVVAMMVAVAVASLMWWTYFAYVPAVGEAALARATATERGVVARDFYTFGHFPLVLGTVYFAVVVEHLLEHPVDPLSESSRWLLFLSMLTFVGALVLQRHRLSGRWSPERLVTIAAAAVLCSAGARLAGIALVALVALALGTGQAIRFVLYRRETGPDVG
jgi:low temperature requirement protein LtrA